MRELLNLLKQPAVNMAIYCCSERPEYDEELVQSLESVRAQASNYISDRLGHLETISRLMYIASQDKDIGSFDMEAVASMAFFFEEEAKALESVNFVLSNATYNLLQHARSGGEE